MIILNDIDLSKMLKVSSKLWFDVMYFVVVIWFCFPFFFFFK